MYSEVFAEFRVLGPNVDVAVPVKAFGIVLSPHVFFSRKQIITKRRNFSVDMTLKVHLTKAKTKDKRLRTKISESSFIRSSRFTLFLDNPTLFNKRIVGFFFVNLQQSQFLSDDLNHIAFSPLKFLNFIQDLQHSCFYFSETSCFSRSCAILDN